MLKLCKRCNEQLPLGLFSPRKDAKDGLAYWCTPCKSKATTASPRRSEVSRAYYERNKAECATRVAASIAKKPAQYAKKKAEWVQKNKPRLLSMRRTVYALNPAKDILRVRLRQKRIKQVPSWLSQAHMVEIEGLYRFCNIFKGFEVDHIIPLNGKQVSGLHVPENLQVLTVRANRQKGAQFKE